MSDKVVGIMPGKELKVEINSRKAYSNRYQQKSLAIETKINHYF